jgi:hypothetical protein
MLERRTSRPPMNLTRTDLSMYLLISSTVTFERGLGRSWSVFGRLSRLAAAAGAADDSARGAGGARKGGGGRDGVGSASLPAVMLQAIKPSSSCHTTSLAGRAGRRILFLAASRGRSILAPRLRCHGDQTVSGVVHRRFARVLLHPGEWSCGVTRVRFLCAACCGCITSCAHGRSDHDGKEDHKDHQARD